MNSDQLFDKLMKMLDHLPDELGEQLAQSQWGKDRSKWEKVPIWNVNDWGFPLTEYGFGRDRNDWKDHPANKAIYVKPCYVVSRSTIL